MGPYFVTKIAKLEILNAHPKKLWISKKGKKDYLSVQRKLFNVLWWNQGIKTFGLGLPDTMRNQIRKFSLKWPKSGLIITQTLNILEPSPQRFSFSLYEFLWLSDRLPQCHISSFPADLTWKKIRKIEYE